jgi:site-specific DNA-cytosine methylase
MIKVGSDFSGVGAFDFALGRIKPFETIFACDWDKYARQSYIANHGEPPYYPSDVYDREIPEESLDIYMTSPPCQSFSLAGKREVKIQIKEFCFLTVTNLSKRTNHVSLYLKTSKDCFQMMKVKRFRNG